ncbi:MAG: M6 family metalloprotease domain-containing protein [Phycisphaerae bacterium]|nr:M6 family metalloprotease domain-containing protein [Phycisphaerae bacterium]
MLHITKNCGHARFAAACGCLVLACAYLPALAAPLPSEIVTLTQPDGRTFAAWAGGDEWSTWIVHEESLIVRDDRGWWCYAEPGDGGLVPGRGRVGLDRPGVRTATREDIPALAAQIERPPGLFAEQHLPGLRSVDRPVLVVLVAFQDQALTTTDAYWNNLLFGTTGKTVRTYYDEVSGGSLHLVPASESSGTVDDGVVRVQLSTSAHNSGNHPNPYGTIDNRNRWIVYDALSAADGLVDFSALDVSAPTGTITADELHLVIVVAGYEHGYWVGVDPPTPAIHSHRWALGFAYSSEMVPTVTADGVELCDYAYYAGYVQVGELHTDHPTTVGVPCHELGHDMGLIDLYDTTLASHGIGAHGVMGYGVWGTAATDTYLGETPVHMCAPSKAQLGFVTPTVANGNQDYSLWATGSSSYNVVRANTRDPNQYFLLENRELQGFDAGLYRWFSLSAGGADGGLAVWHVDDAVTDNTTASHKHVDLEEANCAAVGYAELDYLTTGNPPPEQGKREHYYRAGVVGDFGDATNPNSRLYSGGTTYVNVSSVSAGGETMKCFVATQPAATRVVEWSTYLGGSAEDQARGVAIDPVGNIYVGGTTNSANFPTTPGAYDRNLTSGQAAFASKFSSGGNLVYSTLFETSSSTGGTNSYAIAADSAGSAYLTGSTTAGLPLTAGAWDTSFGGTSEAYVAKLDPGGAAVVYATYVGGTESVSTSETGYGIAVDAGGNACVVGQTDGSGFPKTHGAYAGLLDTFTVRLNPTGTGVSYAWLLGSPYGDWGWDVVTDASGNAYVTGTTTGSTYPTTAGAYDQTHNGGRDVFLTKLGPTGSFDYSTFLGGSSQDYGMDVALDGSGYVYLAGYGLSSDFPTTPGVIGPVTVGGTQDAFVAKLDATPYGSLQYCTFLGGSASDDGNAIAIDSQGRACLAGVTGSTDFLLQGAFYGDAGGIDGFGSVISDDATALEFSTYLGAALEDRAWDVVVDAFDALYIVGATFSTDFPVTPGAYDTTHNGGQRDAFISKIGWAQVTSSLVVGAPDGGEVWHIGRTNTIGWSSSGAGSDVSVELLRNGSWETLWATTPNDGSESWTVTGAAATDCRVRIQYAAGGLTDQSNADFRIAVVGDHDGDGDLDAGDYAVFAECLSGPGATPAPTPPRTAAECLDAFDFDSDTDVDAADFAAFQAAYTG